MSLAISVDWVDASAVGILVLFGAWGAFHGLVRQVLGLVVILVAFALAGPLGPRIEGSLSKVVTLSPTGTACAAWGTALFGVLVAGAILLHLVRAPLNRTRLGVFDRPAGAVVGLVKGAVVLVLAAYVLLGWYAGEKGPAVVASLRESATARFARTLEERYRPLLRLPLLVEERVDEVNAGIVPREAP